MKKLMLLCLAALLVLAFTLPATAKTTLSASGSAVYTGYYLTNVGADLSAGTAVANAFQTMEANIMFRLQTNPKLWFQFGLNLMDRYWGYQADFGYNRYWDDEEWQSDMFNDDANLAEVTHANITYLVYKGYIFIGRGQLGPGARGAMQTSVVGANRDWKASDSYYDTISVRQTFGPWALAGSASKVAEMDGPSARFYRDGNAEISDGDYDSLTASVTYNQKWGYVSGGFNWTRIRNNWYGLDIDNYNPSATVYVKFGKAWHVSARPRPVR
jgi:hypothetical protein